MRKKVFLLLTAVTALVTQLTAAPVSRTDALETAKAFMSSMNMTVKQNLKATDGPRKVGALDQNPAFYVFNNGDDEGFVIVSGDDRTEPILGYSETGYFDMDLLNENVGSIVGEYARQMEYLDQVALEDSKGIMRTQTPTTSPVLPLLTTKWKQTSPFNNACPLYPIPGSTTRTVLGCTAVAAGQYIYYFKNRMPATLQKEIPAYSPSYIFYDANKKGYRINVSKIAAGTAFNWKYMFDKYDGSQSSTQISAVSKFLFFVAAALQSNFKQGVTSAYFEDVDDVLKATFGFKSNYTKELLRENYTYRQWKKFLVNSLESKIPIYYGATKENGDAHAFILDGYDGGDLFHINWGWGGVCNGYFSLSVLNQYDLEGNESVTSGASYNARHMMYLGLQPTNGYVNFSVDDDITSLINSASGSTAKVTFYNNTTNAITVKCGLGYQDANGNWNLVKEWGLGTKTLAAGKNSGVISFTLSFNDVPESNQYAKVLYPIYKANDEQGWQQCEQTTNSQYIAVSGTSKTGISLALKSNVSKLTAEEFEFPGSRSAGASQPVIVTVKATGKDFYGKIYLFASTTSSMGSQQSSEELYIPEGKTAKVALSFLPGTAGTYNVKVATNTSCSSPFGSTKVTIGSASSTTLSIASYGVKNLKPKSSWVVLGCLLSGKATIKNTGSKPYSGNIKIKLFYSSNNWNFYSNDYITRYVQIPANGTAQVEYSFNDIVYGMYYGLGFVDENNTKIASALGYSIEKAVMTYDANKEMTALPLASSVTINDNMLAVDLRGMTGTVKTIVPNKNPNTLYFVNASETVPAGLTGKNVVKGTVAPSISISDAYDFFTPVTFTATNISFSYVPTIGTAPNKPDGWQTLALPFAPDKVTCNNKLLDWFKSASDTRKNMWIKDFSALEGYNTVCFGFAQTLQANRPYLIAVPGSQWGSEHNLVGKTIVFSASNAVVTEDANVVTGSDAFNFRGTFQKKSFDNIYVLNANGNKFVCGTNTVQPFRCYFVNSNTDMTNINDLNIGTLDETDGIMMPFAAEGETVDVYNINGMKVGKATVEGAKINIDDLPKGIYVIKGKKMIKY